MRRGRGFTLVEALVALILVFMSMGVLWNVWTSANRQGSQIERGAELMQAASLLQEVLSWDLLRSLPLTVMEDRPLTRGVADGGLVLPYYDGYDGSFASCRAYRELAYRFDRDQGVLYRAGQPILRGQVADVQFRWSVQHPTFLEVVLVGQKGMAARAPRFVIRLPAPQGTDEDRHWQAAVHHRGARKLEARAESGGQP